MQTIRRGDGYNSNGTAEKRPTVKAGQVMMGHHGFVDLRSVDDLCGADGIFGPGTETAVKDFQSARALVIDGDIGPTTWAELEKDG